MVEAVLQFTTPALLEFQLKGKFTRLGNRNAAMAPQGIYKASGKDGWFACTVASAKGFSELAKLVGRPDLAKDDTLLSDAGRQSRHDEIDVAINKWAGSKSPHECAQALQDIGIAAVEVLNIADLLDHRHMKFSELFIDIDRELSGKQRQMGAPFFLDGKRVNSLSAAPLLGQHTFDVLTRNTGVTAARFEELVASGVISFAPKPVRNLVRTSS
jgi:crotonobetainyl-CoA:carnitine CoA-transferase CaiB-like acyl-CoA transferase